MLSRVARPARGAFTAHTKSVLFSPALQRTPVLRTARFYADAGKDKKVLDDDLLTRAGITEKEAVPKTNADAKESGADGEQAGDEEGRKWESTARAPRSESRQVQKRTRRAWLGTGAFFAAIFAYLARPLDEEEKAQHPELGEGWNPAGAWQRMRARYFTTVDHFAAPVFEKLLPDPLPAPYDRPTLVIAVDDVLVKSQWSRKYGWRVAKRPGVDYFLGYLAQYYEIVLFSDKYQAMAAETVLKLDPLRASVSYALFREATRYDDGILVKDLRNLNRDLRKVIVIDSDPDAIKLQPENALVLPPWKGNADDADLIRLIPLLEWIGAQPIKDVRPILQSYSSSPDGVLNEFERRDKLNRQKWAQRKSSSKPSLNSLLGLGTSPSGDLMPQDVIRIESQKNYEKFRQHVEEYGKKMVEEEEKKMKEAMTEHKLTLNKWLSGETPSEADLAATVAKQEAERQAGANAKPSAN